MPQIPGRWWVKLEDTGYLPELAANFNDSGLAIVEHGGELYLRSTEFDTLNDAADVREKAAELIAIACGAAEIELGRFGRPSIAMVRPDQEGVPGAMYVQINPVIEPRRLGLSEETGRWASLALEDDDVKDVLAIFGRVDVRWHDLYHVFEIVEADVGGRMFDDGWATQASASRFTQTANSRGALGREARHGHAAVPPPANPMTLIEARTLVRAIVRRWLRHKAE